MSFNSLSTSELRDGVSVDDRNSDLQSRQR
jgi:hypothetical protein